MEMTATPSAGERRDTSAQKRVMNVFLIIDTSGSMTGEPIGMVNQAIRETIPDLVQVQKNSEGAEIRIAIMKFDNAAKWVTPPEPVEDYAHVDFGASGGTNAGAAFELLSSKLSRAEFLHSAGGHYAPLILFLTDGESFEGWQSKLDELKKNNWFKAAIKVVLAAGLDATTAEAWKLFKSFTNEELIFYANTPEKIKGLIQLLTVHTSQWVTQGGSRGGAQSSSQASSADSGLAPDPFEQDGVDAEAEIIELLGQMDELEPPPPPAL